MIRMRTFCLGIPILLMMSSVASAGNFTVSYRNGQQVRVEKYQDTGQTIIFWRYGGRLEVPKTIIAQIRDDESGALKIFAKTFTTAEIRDLRKRQSKTLRRLDAYQLRRITAAQRAHQKELELEQQKLEEQRQQEKQRELEEQLQALELLQQQNELELSQQQVQEQPQHDRRLKQRVRGVYFPPHQQQKQYVKQYNQQQKQYLEQYNQYVKQQRLKNPRRATVYPTGRYDHLLYEPRKFTHPYLEPSPTLSGPYERRRCTTPYDC